MHIEIQRSARKPYSFRVVLRDWSDRFGILIDEIPSFAEARRFARNEGGKRGVPVVNKVEDDIEHASPARHDTGPLGGATCISP